MKSLIAATAIVALGATSAAACGWKSADTLADLDVKSDTQQSAMQSTPVTAPKGADAKSKVSRERPQLAADPRAETLPEN
ncbi:hypothetical protein [Rhodovibrio salinarum]|uniref:Lipoprotein n=1 Tax=Rhodovibrio salinarum TaxID=1087 RepID=A0A934V0U0_9PROT|nr:hypothetical protein [Rhodovibrio salinarum]MBK1698667.1 hypothetical protein [Rhodovibrio salinarum]